ncbi:MAG: lecithin retinol acyltransferase family protein [Limnoraphis sp.]
MAKGDHIYVDKGLFDHHGIDCGDGTVIHYSGSIKGGMNKIIRVSKSTFAKGKQIRTKIYQKKYSPDEIVNRAERRLKKSHTEGYDVLFNNCEHFAYDCTTGEPDSWQVINAGAGVAGFGAAGAVLGTATTQVAAGGILGLVGFTTTVAAFPLAAVLGGAAATGLAVYKVAKWIDNSDSKS